MKPGTVYLIGAGPGHPELITVMGLKLIMSAEAVVYDDLVPTELINQLPSTTEKYYVGKRAGRHYQLQEETSDLLVKLANEGKSVVRLKGGDPLIFARGGEEATHLAENGISFQIIPGISAVNASASAAGIPLTDRRDASWLTLATGHKAISDSARVKWKQLAGVSDGTIAIYMGIGSLKDNIDKLIAGGMNPEIPSAIVSRAFSNLQQIVDAPLGLLHKRANEAKIETPALVIIGEAVKRRSQMNWWPQGPLYGKRVLVTRPQEYSQQICRQLRDRGAEPLPMATIEIEPFIDAKGWDWFGENVSSLDWIVFTSRTGVLNFVYQLLDREYDIRKLGSVKIAVVGSGTVEELLKCGLKADFIPRNATADKLADELLDREDLTKARILRVRGSLSDVMLEQKVKIAGAICQSMTVYETKTVSWSEHWRQQIIETPPDYIIFTSSSTINGLAGILGKKAFDKVCSCAHVAVIGASTANAAINAGINEYIQAEDSSITGLLDSMVKHVTTISDKTTSPEQVS